MCIHCETGEDGDCQCDEIDRLRSEIARLREDNDEQCRLHGVGSQRELRQLAVIEEQAREIARLREERRWVPVGERLPRGQSEDVLTARGPWEDGGYSIGIGWWNGEFWMSYGSDRDMPSVAFWQPLPPGPEGDG
jgi:hypothetical protein